MPEDFSRKRGAMFRLQCQTVTLVTKSSYLFKGYFMNKLHISFFHSKLACLRLCNIKSNEETIIHYVKGS